MKLGSGLDIGFGNCSFGWGLIDSQIDIAPVPVPVPALGTVLVLDIAPVPALVLDIALGTGFGLDVDGSVYIWSAIEIRSTH